METSIISKVTFVTLTLALTLTLASPWATTAAETEISKNGARATRSLPCGGKSLCRTRRDVTCAAHANGCSIPKIARGGFDKEMIRVLTPSCNRHDMCYYCGRYYSVNRNECDTQFLTHMLLACRNLSSSTSGTDGSLERRRRLCQKTAKTFHLAVAIFGRFHYKKSGPMSDVCPQVKHCFDSRF